MRTFLTLNPDLSVLSCVALFFLIGSLFGALLGILIGKVLQKRKTPELYDRMANYKATAEQVTAEYLARESSLKAIDMIIRKELR